VLQAIYGAVGACLVLLPLFPSVRKYLAAYPADADDR
jgi:hypothetical protein